jgi:hypothetical protein
MKANNPIVILSAAKNPFELSHHAALTQLLLDSSLRSE